MSAGPVNLSLRQLRAFLAIGRLESFTRAAEQMHISQAGLSGMLRDVETQLGCRLFERTTRRVSLTDQGQMLMPVAAQMLLEFDNAHASLERLSQAQSRTLVVGTTPLVASCVMPAICAAFAKQRPEITVIVRDLGRGAIEEGVRAGALDAGFGVFLDASSDVRSVKLMTTPLMLVTAPRERPVRDRKSLHWSDLKTLPLIGLPLRNPIQQCVDAQLAALGRANEARPTFNYLHTMLAMVQAGAGNAILPSFVAAASPFYRVGLARLTPKVDVDFFEITRAGKPRSSAVTALGVLLEQALTYRNADASPGRAASR